MGEKQNQPFHLLFNASLKVDFQGSRVTSNGGLILVQPLAAARAAEENRRLVADKLVAAAGEDRREAGYTRRYLLALAGRKSPHAAAVREHAAQDRGATDTIGLALPLRLQNLEPKEEGRHRV